MKYLKNLEDNFLNFSILIVFLIILSRLLFYFSGYILEDSFIVFRSAFNYADYGNFSYNIDEHNFSAVTSKIFGLTCAFFRILFKEYAVLFIMLFNISISLIAGYNFYKFFIIFFQQQNLKINNLKKTFLFILIFFNPSILVIGNTGLEYSYVLLFISFLFLYLVKNINDYKILLFCALLPATRFELIAVNLIFIFVFFIFQNKKFIYLFFFSIAGLLLNFLLNLYFDNTIFPSSAISKWMTLSKVEHLNLNNFINYFFLWFFTTKSFFIGVITKIIPKVVYIFVSGICIALCLYQMRYLNIFVKFRENANIRIFKLIISLNIIFVPMSYVIAGHSFVWYFFPFAFLNYIFLGYLFLTSRFFNKINFIISVFLLLFLCNLQFLVLKNTGFQENTYRSHVGQYVQDISNNRSDILFLEPAGYIPYFAKIKIVDTVGLASPIIRKYRKKDKIPNWWFNYVFNEKPRYVIDRRNVLLNGNVRDGLYVLNKDELEWFRLNYDLKKKFYYKDYVKDYAGAFKEIYNIGDHSDYYLFEIKN